MRTIATTSLAIAAMVFVSDPRSASAGCPCNSDINNSGGANPVNVVDVAIVSDCANDRGCGDCISSCDVNCDGIVDFVDVGAVYCSFQMGADCCNLPDGACTHSQSHSPSCIVTDPVTCTDQPGVFEGTYHGDYTACNGEEVIDIPAASEWGLTSLALLILIGGTLVIRPRASINQAGGWQC